LKSAIRNYTKIVCFPLSNINWLKLLPEETKNGCERE